MGSVDPVLLVSPNDLHSFVNFHIVSSVSFCFIESSSLFCSAFLLFRENLESLDCPGILADKALRCVQRLIKPNLLSI